MQRQRKLRRSLAQVWCKHQRRVNSWLKNPDKCSSLQQSQIFGIDADR